MNTIHKNDIMDTYTNALRIEQFNHLVHEDIAKIKGKLEDINVNTKELSEFTSIINEKMEEYQLPENYNRDILHSLHKLRDKIILIDDFNNAALSLNTQKHNFDALYANILKIKVATDAIISDILSSDVNENPILDDLLNDILKSNNKLKTSIDNFQKPENLEPFKEIFTRLEKNTENLKLNSIDEFFNQLHKLNSLINKMDEDSSNTTYKNEFKDTLGKMKKIALSYPDDFSTLPISIGNGIEGLNKYPNAKINAYQFIFNQIKDTPVTEVLWNKLLESKLQNPLFETDIILNFTSGMNSDDGALALMVGTTSMGTTSMEVHSAISPTITK